MRKMICILAVLLGVITSLSAQQVPFSQNDVQPLLLYKAEQDARCRQWVDSVMNRLSLKEKIGQLFIYTIAASTFLSSFA